MQARGARADCAWLDAADCAARGDAVSDRVYKVRFDRIAICSRRSLRAASSVGVVVMVVVVVMIVMMVMIMVVIVVVVMMMVMMILSHHHRLLLTDNGVAVALALGAQDVLCIRNGIQQLGE
jgi:hypothetical protein